MSRAIAAGLLLAGTALSGGASAISAQAPVARAGPGPLGVQRPGTLVLDARHLFGAGDGGPEATTGLGAAWGVGGYGTLGVRYVLDSAILTAGDEEFEAYGRLAPLSSDVGAPFDLIATLAYNSAPESVDGELAIGYPVFPRLTLFGAGRYLSNARGAEGDGGAFAGMLGARAELPAGLELAADAVFAEDTEDAAWRVGLDGVIPGTSVLAGVELADAASATLHGSSYSAGGVRAGVRVTVPIALGGSGGAGGAARLGVADLVAGDTLRVALGDAGFEPARATVPPGAFVLWENTGDDVHGATADDGGWAAPFLGPQESYGRVFTTPGEHRYTCPLHPEHSATVVVEPGG